jgi:hypothetical protein
MRIGGELSLPLAKHKDSTRRLSLNKNGRAFWEDRGIFIWLKCFRDSRDQEKKKLSERS